MVIGEGDALGGATPPTQVPNPQGVSSAIFGGLSMATDVLEIGAATYVLELSTDLAGAPGRVVRFAAPGAAPEVVADG